MTWETYCRDEAAECEKLARDTRGEDRKLWADAARQWRARVGKARPPEDSVKPPKP